jgi:hypothetical protein
VDAGSVAAFVYFLAVRMIFYVRPAKRRSRSSDGHRAPCGYESADHLENHRKRDAVMGDYTSGAPDGGQQASSLADRLKAMMNEYGVAPDGGQQTSSPADRLNAIINGYGTQAAIGVRKGASSILGLPVDLASLPINAGIWTLNKTTGTEVPYVTDPVGGSKQLDELLALPTRGAQAVMGRPREDPEPRSARERIGRRFGEEIGAAAVPAAGVLGAAARVGVQGVRKLPSLARMFVEPAAAEPEKYFAKEMAAAGVSGRAAGSFNEATNQAVANSDVKLDDSQRQWLNTTGDMLGALGALGGFGLYSVGQKIAGAGRTAAAGLLSKAPVTSGLAQRIMQDEIARRTIRPRTWLGHEGATLDDWGNVIVAGPDSDTELKQAVMR